MDFREIKETFIDVFKYIILAIAILMFVLYVVTLQEIIGPSMEPKLTSGNVVLLNKIKYRISEIDRFDIVAFGYKDSKYLVKRVIGLPGDRVLYKDNELYINDEKIEEKFLSEDVITHNFTLNDIGYSVIPDDMYLLIGDNREDSFDGRDFGLISKKQIKGKVFLRIWPLFDIKLIK